MVKIDVDDNPDTAESQEVCAMPTFQFYKYGNLVDEVRGAKYAELVQKVEANKFKVFAKEKAPKLSKVGSAASKTPEDDEIEIMGVKYVKKAVKHGKGSIGSFPTRFQYVGNLLCLFCSCYKLGRFPVCSIGPSWAFTICLIWLAGLFIGCILYMMQLQDVDTWNYYIVSVTFTLNLTLMVSGIIADPGVSAKTYLYYSKMYNQVDGDATSSDEETNASTLKDDENPNALV